MFDFHGDPIGQERAVAHPEHVRAVHGQRLGRDELLMEQNRSPAVEGNHADGAVGSDVAVVGPVDDSSGRIDLEVVGEGDVGCQCGRAARGALAHLVDAAGRAEVDVVRVDGEAEDAHA